MALVCVPTEKTLLYIQTTIEEYFHTQYGLRQRSLSTFLSESQFRTLCPHIKYLKPFLVHSKSVHGFLHPRTNKLLVHPDSAFRYFRSLKKRHLPKPILSLTPEEGAPAARQDTPTTPET